MKAGAVGWNRHSYLKFDLAELARRRATSSPRRCGCTPGWTTRSRRACRCRVRRRRTTGPRPADLEQQAGRRRTLPWSRSRSSGTTGKYYEVDLTTYLRQKKAAGATVATVVLKAGATSGVDGGDHERRGAARRSRRRWILRVGAGPSPRPDAGDARADARASVRDGTFGGTNYGRRPGSVEARRGRLLAQSYLRFDVGSLDTVSSAKLRLFGRSVTSRASTVRRRLRRRPTRPGPSPASPTTTARPPADRPAHATVSVTGTTDTWIEWDLTGFLQSELAAGRQVVTLVLSTLDASSASLNLASDEAASNQPELVVTP